MSGIPFKFFWLLWLPIVRMQGLVTHKFSREFLNSNICPNAYDYCTDSSMPPPRTTVYYMHTANCRCVVHCKCALVVYKFVNARLNEGMHHQCKLQLVVSPWLSHVSVH